MKYTKPELLGYSALAVVHDLNSKQNGDPEIDPLVTDPAYQADE